MSSRTRPLPERTTLHTSDGCQLDAVVTHPFGATVGAAVVAHPHPLYGGNQQHPIVRVLCSSLAEVGLLAVSFDFRGTGRSTGTHGGGEDELQDIDAAITYAHELVPHGCLAAAGYSFGGVVALRSAHPDITHRVGVAAPFTAKAQGAGPSEPTLLVVPRHDQYLPPDQVQIAVQSWSTAPTVLIVESADHFLQGFAQAVSGLVTTWLLAPTADAEAPL